MVGTLTVVTRMQASDSLLHLVPDRLRKTMRLFSSQSLSAILLLAMLASCATKTNTPQSEEATQSRESSPTVSSDSKPEPSPTATQLGTSTIEPSSEPHPSSQAQPSDNPALAPGTYCYEARIGPQDYDVRTQSKSVDAQININADNSVTGRYSGYANNPEESYQVAYDGYTRGTLNAVGDLELNVITHIENSLQSNFETWKISQDTLLIPPDHLTKVNCSRELGLEVTNNFQLSDVNPNAYQVGRTPVYFDEGKSSKTVSGSMIEGYYMTYIVGAQRGQQLSLKFADPRQSSRFNLVTPSQNLIGRDLSFANITLPETGDYQIIVGSEQMGKNPFDLEIVIE